MSLQSYEAIYDHGQMKWLGDKPQVEEARVIVTTLSGLSAIATSVKHQPSTRIAGKGKLLATLFPRQHRQKIGIARNDRA